MKKNWIVLGLLAISTAMYGEVTHAVGVQFGFDRQLMRLNNPLKTMDKTKLEKSPLNGVKIGFVYDVNLVKGFGLYTALNYSFTTHTEPWQDYYYTPEGRPSDFLHFDYRAKSEAHTVDLNLEFEYKFEIAGNTYLTFYTGPSIAWIAKYAAQDFLRDHNTQSEQEIHTYVMGYNAADMATYYRRWNATWGIGAAFQYGRYFIRGGYDFGLINPYRYGSYGEMLEGSKVAGLSGLDMDRITRGRFDNWSIKLGFYLWDSED
ncbi:MAG: PorT family protein [Paludibacteraceae bacterium]|nr:PorT family protein [Paludibacteraceae bacterium]